MTAKSLARGASGRDDAAVDAAFPLPLVAADGGFQCDLPASWRQGPGVVGGLQAAVLLDAATRTVADPSRRVRTLTVHFVARAAPGVAHVSARVVRAGRSLSHARATLRCGDTVVAEALATFAAPRTQGATSRLPMPRVPHWSGLSTSRHGAVPPEFTQWLRFRDCLGSPFAASPVPVIGGWGRFADAVPLDARAIAALADAWPPASLAQARAQHPVASVDLRLHFHDLPEPAAPGWVLYRGETHAEHHGFADEGATLWAEDGRVLATVRQNIVSFPAAQA